MASGLDHVAGGVECVGARFGFPGEHDELGLKPLLRGQILCDFGGSCLCLPPDYPLVGAQEFPGTVDLVLELVPGDLHGYFDALIIT